MEIGQQKLATHDGQNLKADSQLKTELSDLPLPPSRGVSAIRDNILKLGTLLLLLAGVIFLVFYARGNRKVKTIGPSTFSGLSSPVNSVAAPGYTEKQASGLVLERQHLLENIGRLNLSHANGGFKGKVENYKIRKANLKARLIQIWELGPEEQAANLPRKALQTIAASRQLTHPNSIRTRTRRRALSCC